MIYSYSQISQYLTCLRPTGDETLVNNKALPGFVSQVFHFTLNLETFSPRSVRGPVDFALWRFAAIFFSVTGSVLLKAISTRGKSSKKGNVP